MDEVFFLYIYKEKKNWERNQTLFTVFNLKVVLELFHLLFWSSEFLLLLIQFLSGEALVKTSVDFSLCIFLGLFSPFPFPSSCPHPLFFHPYSHSNSLLIFLFFSLSFSVPASAPLSLSFFPPPLSDSFTTSHLSMFSSVYNSLFVFSIADRILMLSAEVHER